MKKTIIRLLSAVLTITMLATSFSAAIPAVAPQNDFRLAQTMEIYLLELSSRQYSRINGESFISVMNGLPKLKEVASPSKEKAAFTLLAVNPARNFSKTTIELRPGELRFGKTSYRISKGYYDRLVKAIGDAAKEKSPCPQWLTWMNPNRIIHFMGWSGNIRIGANKPSWSVQIQDLVETLRFIEVKDRSFKRTDERFDANKQPVVAANDLFFELTFDNDVIYHILIKGDKLYITSSDMDFGCEYTLKNNTMTRMLRQKLREVNNTPMFADLPDGGAPVSLTPEINPATGKPVIYLYPEKTRDVSVKVHFKGELCYTFPAYNGGWNVTASPDGTLVNKADGTTHYYLFWDGNPDFQDWDMSRGFVVKGSETQKFFEDTMPKLGLTPREYNDFIVYWTPILSRNPYNLLSFSTTQYEAIAPLEITPAPDTVLRVHMLYKALEAPVSVPEQKLPKAPARRGFTVVEWGATRVPA